MIKAVIIGLGNVGTHLSRALQQSNQVEVIQYLNRSPISENELTSRIGLASLDKFTHDFDKIKEADMYFIAVKDDAIEEVIDSIPFQQKIVAHTSGSVALSENAKHQNAVFYPLQTFSKQREVNFSEIPICIEAASKKTLHVLESVANSISNKVFYIDSIQRKQLHLSAVFVCNFVNHLYHIGENLCTSKGIDPQILAPLIQETVAKIVDLSPQDAQTGPALRGDQQTMKAHLEMLKDNTKLQELYQLISASIQEHGKKL